MKVNIIDVIIMLIDKGHLLDILTLGILLCGWIITLGRSISIMFRGFTWQTSLLGMYILFVVFHQHRPLWITLSISLIVFIVIIVFRNWLWRALVTRTTTRTELLEYGKVHSFSLLVVVSIGLSLVAFLFVKQGLVPKSLPPDNQRIIIYEAFGLGVSLILLGLAIMMTRNDLMAQSIGLIVSENGLYLSGYALIAYSSNLIITWFIIGTWVFMLMTFVTLRYLLRFVHDQFKSFDMTQLRHLKG